MCSHFLEIMENYQGDLTDMLKATCGNTSTADHHPTNIKTAPDDEILPEWTFQSDPIGYPVEDFGDPFGHLRDPLLLHDPASSSSFFIHHHHSNNIIKNKCADEDNRTGVDSGSGFAQKDDDHEMARPLHNNNNNIFSRMLQISPTCSKLPVISSNTCGHPPHEALIGSPRSALASPNQAVLSTLVANNDHHHQHHLNIASSPNSAKAGCLVESSAAAGVQISSPRNTGIKRRKSQAKKVVCIPAPAPANSRASGEIVPSDLWAWRKYGQKPIKGSPYPRGYYRCSSSKGCSARKQVERSRTDPNMLVITYTSDHNHPWPTQRNALAGSTRSQQSKNNITNSTGKTNATSSSKAPQNSSRAQKADGHANPKQEPDHNYEMAITTENTQQQSSVTDHHDGNCTAVKEEINVDQEDHNFNNRLESEGQDYMMDEGFAQGYKPSLQESSNAEDSFFAELGEIEATSLDMLLRQGFSGAGDDGGSDRNKGLDSFNFYDWDGTINNDDNNSNNDNKATSTAGARTPKRDT